MVIECAENVVMRQYEQQVLRGKKNLSTELCKLPLRVMAFPLHTPPQFRRKGEEIAVDHWSDFENSLIGADARYVFLERVRHTLAFAASRRESCHYSSLQLHQVEKSALADAVTHMPDLDLSLRPWAREGESIDLNICIFIEKNVS